MTKNDLNTQKECFLHPYSSRVINNFNQGKIKKKINIHKYLIIAIIVRRSHVIHQRLSPLCNHPIFLIQGTKHGTVSVLCVSGFIEWDPHTSNLNISM